MEKISPLQNKFFLSMLGIFAIFFSVNSPSYAAFCNSPCPNPCAPSRTVCEGTNCTTYCNSVPSARYSATYYTYPAVSFSYAAPNVRFSISNEVYGMHNYYTRPNIIISNGFRPVYHRVPVNHIKRPPKKPHHVNKPSRKPANRPSHPDRRH